MAEPAHRNAAGPEAPGWPEYRRQMIARAQAVEAAVTAYLAAADAAGMKAAIAALAIAAFLEQGAVGRDADFSGELAREVCARSAGQDRPCRPRGRGRLRAVT